MSASSGVACTLAYTSEDINLPIYYRGGMSNSSFRDFSRSRDLLVFTVLEVDYMYRVRNRFSWLDLSFRISTLAAEYKQDSPPKDVRLVSDYGYAMRRSK
jgi:hypothetical protein